MLSSNETQHQLLYLSLYYRDTPFTQNDFETFPTIMVKAECQTRELTSNKRMLDSDDLEIVAIGTEEHYGMYMYHYYCTHKTLVL